MTNFPIQTLVQNLTTSNTE